MIAEIYLIKRLPRRFDVFDYTIPDNMKVRRGSLVLVPFRNMKLRAVVAGLKETSEQKNLKDVAEVKDLNFLSDAELAIYETIAEQVVQSVSAMLDATFPPARKRASSIKPEPIQPITNKIRSSEIKYLKHALELIATGGHHFVETIDLAQAAAIVQASLSPLSKRGSKGGSVRQTLVLVPNTHDADLVARALSQYQPTILDSRSTLPQRSDIANSWRNGSIQLLVATRIGSLLPAKELGAIFILRSGVDEHAQYDRNPRYDAREAAYLAHQATHATLIMFGPIPRVQDLKRFKSKLELPSDLKPETVIIDLKTESQRSDLTLLNDQVIKAINKALQAGQKVLCSYNRKGSAPRLSCRDCQHLIGCVCGGVPTVYEQTLKCHRCDKEYPIPLTCPKCNGTELTKRGVGNRAIEKRLRELFPENTIARIEKGSEPVGEADIILATQHYFEMQVNPFALNQIGLMIELAADIGLSEPYYTATENTLQRILELQGLAWRAACPFIVQTWTHDLVSQMLNDPHEMLRAEADVHKHFNYPPFGTLWRIKHRRSDNRKVVKLQDVLTDVTPDVKINQLNENAWEIRVGQESVGTIKNILKKLDDSYIIEVNPERKL